MNIRPINLREANAFVAQNHRHHGPKTGYKFAIALYDGDRLAGVAICANPVGRKSDDGLTLEVSRLCTDGTRNACSMLYSACARIAKGMGYRKIQTYILESENGASLKASGWTLEQEGCGKPSWLVNASERTKERHRYTQESMFEEKKPPEELKKRYVKCFERE